MQIPRIVVAGTESGVGKTSLTLGLVMLLRRRGLRVQTFKVGPDYLDPTYLAVASGRSCYNLDGWMTGEAYVHELFCRASQDADIAVVEGVMGLFDGADEGSLAGSTAQIASWLSAPILLVTNVHGMARSLAALVHGFASFEPGIQIAGVIANHCGSEQHGIMLANSLRAAGLPPLLGTVPGGVLPELPSRHLGLMAADADRLPSATLEKLAGALDSGISLDQILKAARQAPSLSNESALRRPAIVDKNFAPRLGIARDHAFHFYYPDNLEALQQAGCELIAFSPLHDASLPEGLNGIYLGGGYPEEYGAELAGNTTLLESIRAFANAGGLVYAECGGLMYVSQSLETVDGKRHRMLGLLPAATRMSRRLQSLGYREATLLQDSLWGKRGDQVRGHEFHYSELIRTPGWHPAYRVSPCRAQGESHEGFQNKARTILASYLHLHFASRPSAIEHLMRSLQQCGLSVPATASTPPDWKPPVWNGVR
ncbi:MAG TPA: cobyrinate a,c-diamide synthase [Candidatus Angelobacter sp.]|jgi:cobyrinic acid a,c-diamide synthase|nr:cobyrinate a,c-diamide synthase [Candidatus Angelobacter sp.]